MRVLVACEFSGTVRDAFIDEGHDATSCDLLPTTAPGPHHAGDALDILGYGWDLIIAHPPCTYLSNSGVSWLYSDPDDSGSLKGIPRWQAMHEGARFFRAMLDAPAPRVAVENPVMHKWAVDIVGERQTQTVQPWQFGHPRSKRTGFWLRGLPQLVATDDVRAEYENLPARVGQASHYASPGEDRWALRSLTYPGIATAMAKQWGNT